MKATLLAVSAVLAIVAAGIAFNLASPTVVVATFLTIFAVVTALTIYGTADDPEPRGTMHDSIATVATGPIATALASVGKMDFSNVKAVL